MTVEQICVEQYRLWRAEGLTLREITILVHADWYDGMGGDDVVEAMIVAWNGLDRSSGSR